MQRRLKAHFIRALYTACIALTTSLFAQQVPRSTTEAPPCSPVRDPAYVGFIPSFPDAPAFPELARSLSLGYNQHFALHDPKATIATLTRARADAASARNICADALALYVFALSTEDTNFDGAFALFEEDIKLFQSIHSVAGAAHAEYSLARIFLLRSRLDDALLHYRAAIHGFESVGDTRSALNAEIADVAAMKKPDFPTLLTKVREANFPCLEATLQNSWSDSIHRSNHFDEAMEHAQAAEALYANCPDSRQQRASNQTSMGRMERQQGRALVALEHYRLALQLQQDSGDLSLVPQTYNAMGVAYESISDYTHAIPMYKKGLAVAQDIHSQPLIEFLEGNLAATYARHHQPKLALPLLKNLTATTLSDGQSCTRFGQFGNVYEGTGDLERSLASYVIAVRSCRADRNFDRTFEEGGAQAKVEFKLHRFEDSFGHAMEMLALNEEMREHVIASDAYKQGFNSAHQTRELFDLIIADLTALDRPTQAFEMAEQARSRAFLDLLASHRAAEAAQKPTPTGAQFQKGLIASPEHVTPLTNAAMLDAATRLHSTLLAYWIAKDSLYIWVARPGEAVFEASTPFSSDKLAALVSATHKPQPTLAASLRNWRALYRILIAPIEAHLPPSDGELLTIVPSGPLFALSFPALLAPNGRFLAERYRSHTIPTVGLLSFTQRNAEHANASTSHYLFVNNPARLPLAPDGHPLPLLAGTAVEVDSIVRLLPATQITRLDGRDANPMHLDMSLPTATNLHFATHAILNDADPYASFLALDDADHKGKLTVADIYALHLDVRLVVLSACSTALGKVTGDGVAGMSRAFFYAGAASVLATLWDIADQPTARLIPRFYAALASGQPPSAAIRTAELSMLSDLRHRRIQTRTLAGPVAMPPDPAYWAAFSLTGEP